ncbi:MAG TPA: glutamine synthetase family protein [Hypericibacter adhaerens]|uniref:glutamine synthetase family protein n=1 Tax=Hypericibacter adhaerens TaxID=2602016 RepID=UPI002C1B994C|nr:glutamine synthetase family protein [Hypericibacter adhaerens]HWA43140.1 glutamine synthetase family protein [Hypericibacter adhaerens]
MSSRDLAIFLTNDLTGMSRGRAFPARDLGHRMEAGVGWVPANHALTPFGDIGENPFGPLGDLRLQPETESSGFRLTGFGEEHGLLAFLCDIVETDGRPWGGCPRNFARQALADLERETGLTLKASFEQEFFLLGIDLAINSAFTLVDFRGVQNFLGALTEALTAAGVEPETVLREYGPQQFELTMKPARGLLAADRAVILREITRDVARQFGGRASFAPIIDPASVGSGVHLHFSLETIDGRAATHDPAGPGGISERAGSFVAGVLAHMPALCVLAAPSLISYLRLTPHRWSSGFNCFGYRNREAGIRIAPVDDAPGREIARQTHLEFRAGDATASPYMQLGALVRAGLEGMRAKLPVPPLVEGDPADLSAAQLKKLGVRRLPDSLPAALGELEKDAVAKGWLPEPLQKSFFALKRTEMAKLEHLDAAGQCAKYASVY